MDNASSPEATIIAANQSFDATDTDSFWDFLEKYAETFQAVRLDMFLEHGNAIPPENLIARAREVILENPCNEPFIADNLKTSYTKTLAKQLERDKLSWSEAAWKLLTSSKTTLKGFEKPRELFDIALHEKPKQKGSDEITL